MSEDTTHAINAQEKHATKDYQDLHALMQNVQDLTNEIKARRGMTEHFRRKSEKLQRVIDSFKVVDETRRQSAEHQEEKINALRQQLVDTNQKLYALGKAVLTLDTVDVSGEARCALLSHAGVSLQDIREARPAPLNITLSLPQDRVLVESRALTEDEQQEVRDLVDGADLDYSDAVSAIGMVLSAATEDGHQLSDKQICDSIPWEHLRSVYAKFAQDTDTKQT